MLILGSMPGKKSLDENQYYAHPRNYFWEFMAEILGFDKDLPYEERTRKLKENGIALWDVIHACERDGSLDSSIKNGTIMTKDFQSFFENHTDIQAVFFNGKKAFDEYKKLVLPNLSKNFQDLQIYYLPSTSPANASISKENKLTEWRKIKEYINIS